MNKIHIKRLNKLIDLVKNNSNINLVYVLNEGLFLKDLEALLYQYNLLEDDNTHLKFMFNTFNNRKYRKKYLKLRRKEQPNLLFPDADEIYEKYFELRKENKALKKSKALDYSVNLDLLKQELKELRIEVHNLSKEKEELYNKYIDVVTNKNSISLSDIQDLYNKMEELYVYKVYNNLFDLVKTKTEEHYKSQVYDDILNLYKKG